MTKKLSIDCPKHGKWVVDHERTSECAMCVQNEAWDKVVAEIAKIPPTPAYSRRERLEWLDMHESSDKLLANM